MTERYVDGLNITLVKYDEMPLPEGVVEGWSYYAFVEGKVDLEDLIDQLEASMIPQPFTLDEKYGHFSWGADASILDIILGVSGGLPGAMYVAEKIIAAHRRKGVKPAPLDAESAMHKARSVVAKARQVAEKEVEATAATQEGEDFSVDVTVGNDTYQVRVQEDGVVHFKKKEPPARGSKKLFRRRG